MVTLTLIFNKERTHVLMYHHMKFGKLNYIGGKVEEMEQPMDASYRELYEETGITKDDVELLFVRHESVTLHESVGNLNAWNMFVTTGVLHEDVELKEEKNPLVWISVNDTDRFLHDAYGDGNCYTFLIQSIKRLAEN